MPAIPSNQEIAEYIRAHPTHSLDQIHTQFPKVDLWGLRTLRRDVHRELSLEDLSPATLADAAEFQGLRPIARTALRVGFFRPMEITIKEQRPVKPLFKKAGFQYLVWSDAHAGDEDLHALDVVTQIGQAIDVDEVVFAGDWFDAHAISKYVAHADRPARWVDERAAALPVVASARAAFGKKKAWWLNGNHDTRPARYIDSVAPQLQGLFTLPELLGIQSLDFSYPDDNRMVIADKMLVIHGERVRADAGASVKAEVVEHGMSVLMGHVHRRGRYEVTKTVGSRQGEQPLIGLELGCLCNLHPGYISPEKTANWQHGAAIVTVYDNGYIEAEPISIHQGKAAFRGLLFESRLPRLG
jgi:predicted phosphodiesterase